MRKLTYIVISKTFVQVRALQRPPPGVKLVIDAVCIIKGVKPKKVAGEKVVLYYILNKKSDRCISSRMKYFPGWHES